MMFMTPMPPTMSEMAAMLPNSTVKVCVVCSSESTIWVWSWTKKSFDWVPLRPWLERRIAVNSAVAKSILSSLTTCALMAEIDILPAPPNFSWAVVSGISA